MRVPGGQGLGADARDHGVLALILIRSMVNLAQPIARFGHQGWRIGLTGQDRRRRGAGARQGGNQRAGKVPALRGEVAAERRALFLAGWGQRQVGVGADAARRFAMGKCVAMAHDYETGPRPAQVAAHGHSG